MKLNKILKLSAFTLLCTSSIMAAMGDNMTAGIGVTLGSTVQEQTWMDNSQHYGADGNGPLAGVSIGSSFALSDAATSATVFDFRNTYYQRVRTNAVGITAQHKLKTSEGSIHGVYGGIDYTSYDSMNFWQAALGAETMMLGYKGNLNFYIPFGDTTTYSGVGGSTMTGLYGVDLTLGKMIGMFGLGVQGSYFWNDDIKNNISAVAFGGEYTFAKNMLTTGAAYQYKNGLDSGDYGYKVFARVPLHKGTFSSLTGMNAADGMSTALLYKPVNRMVGGVLQAKDIDCSATGGSSYSAGGVTLCQTNNPFDGAELKAGMLGDGNNTSGKLVGGKTIGQVNGARPVLSGLQIISQPLFFKDGLTIKPGTTVVLDNGAFIAAMADQSTGTTIGENGGNFVTFIQSRDLLSALSSKGISVGAASGIKRVLTKSSSSRGTRGQSLGSSQFSGSMTDSNSGLGLVILGKAKVALPAAHTAVEGNPQYLLAKKLAGSQGSGKSSNENASPSFFNTAMGGNWDGTLPTDAASARALTNTTPAAFPTTGVNGPASVTPNGDTFTANSVVPTADDYQAGSTKADSTITFKGGLLKDVVAGGGSDDVHKGHGALLQNVIFHKLTVGSIAANNFLDNVSFSGGKGAQLSQFAGSLRVQNSSFTADGSVKQAIALSTGVDADLDSVDIDARKAGSNFSGISHEGASSNVFPNIGSLAYQASASGATADQIAAYGNVVDAAAKTSLHNSSMSFGSNGGNVLSLAKLQNKPGAGVAFSLIGNTVDAGNTSVTMSSSAQTDILGIVGGSQTSSTGSSKPRVPVALTDIGNYESMPSLTGRLTNTYSDDFVTGATDNDTVRVAYQKTLARQQNQGTGLNIISGNNITLPSADKGGSFDDVKNGFLKNIGLSNVYSPSNFKLRQITPSAPTNGSTMQIAKVATLASSDGEGAHVDGNPAFIMSAATAADNQAKATTLAAQGGATISGLSKPVTGLSVLSANSADLNPVELTRGDGTGFSSIPSLMQLTSSAASTNAQSAGTAAGKVQNFGPIASAFRTSGAEVFLTVQAGSDDGAGAWALDASKPQLSTSGAAVAVGSNTVFSGGVKGTSSGVINNGTGGNVLNGTKAKIQNLTEGSNSTANLSSFFENMVSVTQDSPANRYSASDITSVFDLPKVGKLKSLGTANAYGANIGVMNLIDISSMTSATGTGDAFVNTKTTTAGSNTSVSPAALSMLTTARPSGSVPQLLTVLAQLGASGSTTKSGNGTPSDLISGIPSEIITKMKTSTSTTS